MGKKKIFCVLLITTVLLCSGRALVGTRQDPNADVFIKSYLSSFELLVDYLMEDHDIHYDGTQGTYAFGYDYEKHMVTHLIRYYESKSNEQIFNKEIITALNVVEDSVSYPLSLIYVTDERITFISPGGNAGIIYMQSNKKPGYFISPDKRGENYRMYKICDHWYRAVMLVR